MKIPDDLIREFDYIKDLARKLDKIDYSVHPKESTIKMLHGAMLHSLNKISPIINMNSKRISTEL